MLAIPFLVSVALGSVGVVPFYAAARRRRTFHQAVAAADPIADAAAKAVSHARSGYGVTLDFSMDSINAVESILHKAYQLYSVAPQLVDARSMACSFGAYVGETMRRNHSGCTWESDNGPQAFYTLYRDGIPTFPMQWCLQCITEGAADDARVPRQRVPARAPLLVIPPAPKARARAAGAY